MSNEYEDQKQKEIDQILESYNLISDETEYSVRTIYGDIVYYKTFEEALKRFLSADGYRVSILTDKLSFNLYREEDGKDAGFGFTEHMAKIKFMNEESL